MGLSKGSLLNESAIAGNKWNRNVELKLKVNKWAVYLPAKSKVSVIQPTKSAIRASIAKICAIPNPPWL
jgi:hypothetical protein